MSTNKKNKRGDGIEKLKAFDFKYKNQRPVFIKSVEDKEYSDIDKSNK